MKKSLINWGFKQRFQLMFILVWLGVGIYVVGHLLPVKNRTVNISLAVLPFKNLNEDQSNQYFVDGIKDEILGYLKGFEDVHVISQTTMEQYPEDTFKTLNEIAKELRASHVLKTSVQKQTDKTRIVMQLIDVKQNIKIWSNQYESKSKDIFSMQSELAREIVKELGIVLSPNDEIRILETPTKNFEAYNLYLKGRFFWDKRKEEDLKRSVKYFEAAIAIDSLYAQAYAGLADSYKVMAFWGWYKPRGEGIIKAKLYANKALSINQNISSAYCVLGEISFWLDWNWKQAESELKKALLLDPSNANARHGYAELLNILGRIDEAEEQIDLAIKYNPHAPQIYSESSQIYYNKYEFEKAIEDTEKAYELGGVDFSHDYRFITYFKLGKFKKAFETFKSKFTVYDQAHPELINNTYSAFGIEGVVRLFLEIEPNCGGNRCYIRARLCMLTGDKKKALEFLENSYEYGEIFFPRLAHCIDFEPLKSDPKFISLVNKLNIN